MMASAWMGMWVPIAAVLLASAPETAEPPPATQATEADTATPAPTVPAEEEARIKPRLELHAPSLRHLTAEIMRSHTGPLVESVLGMLREMGSMSSEGVDMESAASLIDEMKRWPDTSIDAVTFAADTEGRPRWAIRFDWPLVDLHARLAPLLRSETAETLLEGITLESRQEGGHRIALPDTTLAYVLDGGESASLLASHADLTLPDEPFRGSEATEKDAASVLVCRLNFKATEKDSGATFFSSLSAVTDVIYACRVDESGAWTERFEVHWPPGIGAIAKGAMSKVKQTFFVPSEAYGAAVFNALAGQAFLQQTAGLGPQMMMTDSGFTMVGQAGPGPIASHTDSQMCVTVLPGTGFFPVPDIVIQVKTARAEKLIDGLRETTDDINRIHRERELDEPWHEEDVRGRPVFWSAGASRYRGMMPAVMRPVLFVTHETDARDRERDFLVLGLTSTSPKKLVRRWVDLPRPTGRKFLPQPRKVNGQLWVNWRQAYGWLQPYANMSLSVVSRDKLLPSVAALGDKLTEGLATNKLRYTGLTATCRGPIPAGVVAMPTLLAMAGAESAGTDLAREREASRKLKVLHHHAELFRRDMGRWPVELAELDGYVDFAGHPYLLRIDVSAKKRRSEWFEDIFESSDDEEEDDEEDEDDTWINLDDDAFVIDWGRDAWSLGIAPGTFEHLEQLYIDQDGTIHRTEKRPSQATEEAEQKDEGDQS